ncbi:Hypothetical protein SMAX5B_007448, partial [Scophthalmus maximus]
KALCGACNRLLQQRNVCVCNICMRVDVFTVFLQPLSADMRHSFALSVAGPQS